jgi:hypothetical protein
MKRSQIRLAIALPFAWTETEEGAARVEIVLTPSTGTDFEVVPIGTLVNVGEEYSQVYWAIDKKVEARIIWQPKDGERVDSGIKSISLKAQLELGRISAPPNDSGDWDTLLRGSLILPVDVFDGVPNWAELLAKLWPTNKRSDIENVRVEPDGLYLEGQLPDPFKIGNKIKIVLRVPQTASDLETASDSGLETASDLETPLSYFLRQDEQLQAQQPPQTPRLQWKLLTFRFRDPLINASQWVKSQADTFESFALSNPIDGNKTFLDNVVCDPDPDCAVYFGVEKDGSGKIQRINWQAKGIGVRLSIAAKEPDKDPLEAAFYPELLTGSFTPMSDDLNDWIPNPIALISGKPPIKNLDLIRLDLSSENPTTPIKFYFQPRDLAAHIIPSTLLHDEFQELKRDSKNNPIRRAWLCSETGWLSLDSTKPRTPLKPSKDIPASETLINPVPLTSLVASFVEKELEQKPESLSGMDIQVEALKDSYIGVILSSDAGKSILSLWFNNTKTILQTPPVWYYAPQGESTLNISNEREDTPVVETLVPSLTAFTKTQTDKDNLDLEKQLKSVLIGATFFSQNVLAIEAIDSTATDTEIPKELTTSVSWDEGKKSFNFTFSAKELQLWHYFKNCPVVQSSPLSPVSSRDSFLNANRGLIPYRKLNPETKVTLNFPAKRLCQLPKEFELPPSPVEQTIQNKDWIVSEIIFDQRFFLPTLPGAELQLQKNEQGGSTWKWFYRHAVPALDEAYGEVVEVPSSEGGNTNIPIEFTRVIHDRAFNLITGKTKATGWLHATPDNPQGETEIEITQLTLTGLNPHVDFKIKGLDRGFVFQRPRFEDPQVRSALTAFLKSEFSDNEYDLPTFTVNWTQDNNTEIGIVNNGQPLLGHWSKKRQRMISQDAEGVVREEAIGPNIQERRLSEPTITYHTNSYDLTDPLVTTLAQLRLEVAGIALANSGAPNPKPDEGQWTLHDGMGGWPKWRGLPLFPLRLDELSQNGGKLIIKLTVLLLWCIPEDISQVQTESTQELTLTFEDSELTGIKGGIDWQFSNLLVGQPYDEESLRLIRIQGNFKEEPLTTTLSLDLQEVDLEHPTGLLRLQPDQAETSFQLTDTQLTLALKRSQLAFSYEIKNISLNLSLTPEDSLTPEALKLGDNWHFLWQNTDDKDIKWELENNPDNWLFRLKQNGVDLIGDVTLEPNRVGSRQFLFQVSGSKAIPSLGKDSWFKISQDDGKRGGFIGVEFGLPENTTQDNPPERIVLDIAAEIQVLFTDSDERVNDSIHIYDPVSDQLTTIDSNTGDIIDPIALPGFGAASLPQQIIWATKSEDSNKKFKAWEPKSNEVDEQIINSLGNEQEIKLPTIIGSPANPKVQSFSVLNKDNFEIIFTDENDNLFYWDLDNPDRSRVRGGNRLTNPVDSSPGKILVLTSSQRLADILIVAWSREELNSATPHRLYFWLPNDSDQFLGPRPLDQQPLSPHVDSGQWANITALDFLFGTAWVVSGDERGGIKVWNPRQPVDADGQTKVAYTAKVDSPVTAMTVMGTDTNFINLIISGHQDGTVILWDKPNDASFPDNPEPLKDLDKYRSPDGAKIKSLITLGESTLAILDGKGKITLLSIKNNKFSTVGMEGLAAVVNESQKKLTQVLDLRGVVAKSMTWMQGDKLMITGNSIGSRLSGLLRFNKKSDTVNKSDTVSLQCTGWLVLDNDLHFKEEIKKGATRVTRQCSHKIKIFLDRANLPVDAIYKGIGPENDEFIAGVVEHTLRFSAGQRVTNRETDQVERIWQTPQLLRLTTLSRFHQTFLNQTAADGDSSKLVLEAGAIFWLRWSDSAQGKTFGASEIANPDLRIFLRSQPLGQLQIAPVDRPEEQIHLVRLPFAAAPTNTKGFPTIEIPDPNSAKFPFPHDTSGVQPPLPEPVVVANPDLPEQLPEIEYFRRSTQSRFLDRSLKRSTTTFDALWLDENFLNRALRPDDPIEPRGQVSPVFGEPLLISPPDKLEDLIWLRIPLDMSTDLPLNPGSIGNKLTARALVAGILTRKYKPTDRFHLLSGAALFEFPFQVFPLAGIDAAANKLLDLQLVVFAEGSLLRLAGDRIEIKNSNQEEEIITWAKNILATRRRTEGAFIIVDYSKVILVPLSAEAIREELRLARTWMGSIIDQDVRNRLPSQDNLLAPDPQLNLMVFDAYPVEQISPYPGIAATRFRLLPTGNDQEWAGSLRPARLEALTEGKGFVLGCTVRDEVPFVCTEKNSYPVPDVRTLTNRPSVNIRELVTKTLLPPLIDVVSWAARPGELTRTIWNLESSTYQDTKTLVGASQGVTVGLRRPRAIAGANQSVRLKPTKTLGVMGNRFRYSELLLTQVLDRTSNNEFKQGVYGILATKNEIFRSEETFDRAGQTPALIYQAPGQEDPFIFYLVANVAGFQPRQSSTGGTLIEKTLLIWSEEPIIVGSPEPSPDFTIFDVDSPSVPPWKNPFDSVFIKSFDFPKSLKEKLANPSPKPIYISLAHYKLDTRDNTFKLDTTLMVIALISLDRKGRFQPPKTSVSILAYSEVANPSPVLVGYGRLGDDELSPISYNVNETDRSIEWSRTSHLQVLHRFSTGEYYDAVVYGTGGEVFPVTNDH